MDGSCNGLQVSARAHVCFMARNSLHYQRFVQHYAALGRDVAGATEVNLINADQVPVHARFTFKKTAGQLQSGYIYFKLTFYSPLTLTALSPSDCVSLWTTCLVTTPIRISRSSLNSSLRALVARS
jgi:hypothetical protein